MKYLLALFVLLCATITAAYPPRVDDVRVTRMGDTWRFDVTISHPDTGWDHYVDAWRILDMQGNELGTRVLTHPHVDEQPFTRSLSGVRIPEGTSQVQIQAREKPGGWNPDAVIITLP
jgi:hypothetical protein